MALPPCAIGDRSHTVLVEGVCDERWRVHVDGRLLPPTFTSEVGARDAATVEVIRLDAIAYALLRRLRAASSRKQP